ncbi:FAD-binding protein [Streptomyces sp. KL116D]|uniref:FAD-binding protein n=1 Tax=Streptomyces sp. KL116D TaxID=3045152 RepID=UPI0035569A59
MGRFPHIIDRGKPGVIGVLRDGRRFVNEADGYHQYVDAMIRATPEGEEVASWLICDHRYQRRMPFGMSRPFPLPPLPVSAQRLPAARPHSGGAVRRLRHRPDPTAPHRR